MLGLLSSLIGEEQSGLNHDPFLLQQVQTSKMWRALNYSKFRDSFQDQFWVNLAKNIYNSQIRKMENNILEMWKVNILLLIDCWFPFR